MKTITDVFKSIQNTGGASYNINTKTLNPNTGYMVSLQGYTTITHIPENMEQFQRICSNYVMNLPWAILNNLNNWLGFWIDKETNKLVIDISQNIVDKEEAIKQGEYRLQKAIWDCANNCEIQIQK